MKIEWKKKKILLLEDQERGGFFQEYLMLVHKLDVLWVESINEAWEEIQTTNFDLFILDVMVPLNENCFLFEYQKKYSIRNNFGMLTGLLFFHKLLNEKSTDGIPNFKTILFSAKSRYNVEEELKHLNIDARHYKFLSKTSDPTELYKTIENLLK